MPLRKTKDAGRVASGRKRLLVVGVGVLVVLVFVVLPGYLAAQPDFFARYPSLAKQYEPWSTSTHVEASCDACHVRPQQLARAAYRVRMVGDFYVSLVYRSKAPSVFKEPTNDACLVCHSDLRTVSPKGDLQIPHRAHVSILKMRCVECHQYVVHELSPAGKHVPPMAGCLECHDGDTADNACAACHTEKAAPTTHAADDWLIAHANNANNPECITCHGWTDDWCAECHRHRPSSHSSDWRATHGVALAKHRSCEACHEADFCVRCHGDVPQQNLNPALVLVK